jgi:hypothetical protein
MSLRNRNRDRGGRMERTILRVVLVLILAAAGGFWYLERGIGAGTSLFLPVLVGLAAVGSVNWFGRVRARERWEAAWDAYATGETEVDSFESAGEADAELCLAGGR